ncbi:hypothetical protein GGR56DRAFT_200308 [Xylariaceae sp. FL0804]|nr:hypothetical protein GGR56DRAFT_200308 [Xylariaceae sp. FL0804]
MLVAVICATIQTPESYRLSAILVGDSEATYPDEVAYLTVNTRRWNVAVQTVFWTSLYCVKFSFMFLYRTVLRGIAGPKYKAIWVAASIYIILCYGLCLLGVYGQCGDARYLFTYEQCMTPYAMSLYRPIVWISFTFNVTSDFVVILLPMPLIWSLNMRTTQKLAISGLCSLALITVAFETVRSLPSYRFLISPSDKDREYRRLFWTRITMRSFPSNSSGYSMQNYSLRAVNTETARAINTIDEDQHPLPTQGKM